MGHDGLVCASWRGLLVNHRDSLSPSLVARMAWYRLYEVDVSTPTQGGRLVASRCDLQL